VLDRRLVRALQLVTDRGVEVTPEEALAGVTRHAARALGMSDRGVLAPGMRADLAVWDIASPAELAYQVRGNACMGVWHGGSPAGGRS